MEGERDILHTLEQQCGETLELLRGVGEKRAGHRYAPGKWSIKEVVGHLCDSERVFAYRAMRFARNDPTPLPGFEQDDYVRWGGFDERELRELCDELEHQRRSTIELFRGMDEAALARRGTASGAAITVRALPFIIAGHERHHGQVLRERYL